MGQDALAALAAAAEVGKALRGLQARVVQRRRVLHGEDHRLPAAAVGGRFAVRLENVLHGYPRVRQQAVGGLLFRLLRKDDRQVPAHALQPGPAHPEDAVAHPPVGVARAAVLPLRPVRVRAVEGARQRADRAAFHMAERLPPAVLQRGCPHRAGPAPASAGPPDDSPAGAAVAVSAVFRADIGVGRHRTYRIAGLPVVRHPLRGHAQDLRRQRVDPHAGKNQEAMVAEDAPDVGGAGVGRPSDPFVPRTKLPGRRPEADSAKDGVTLRADPVTHLAAGRPRPSQRMMLLHHRLPKPAVIGIAHRIKRDGTKLLQRAGQPGVGNLAGRDGGSGGRIRHVACRRKLKPQTLRERRQRLRRRRKAQGVKGIAPAGALAQIPGQGVTGEVAGTQGVGEPVKRLRIKMAETDLHASRNTRTRSPI